MALNPSNDSPDNADNADGMAFQSRAEEESRAARAQRKPRKARGNGADDPLLPEKKRARRRLVGAIALVVAVVIGLPMVLDSEPKPLAEDIAIQIPAKDKAAPIAPAPAAATPATAAALDQKEEIVEPGKPGTAVPTVAGTAAVVAGAAAAAPAASTPTPADTRAVVAVNSAEPKAAPKAEAKVEAKPADAVKAPEPAKADAKPAAAKADTKPEQKPAAADEAARARALLEGKPDPKAAAKPADTKPADTKPAEAKSDKVVLQVAALATPEKISEVTAKLKSAGIMSYTQKIAVEGGERTRIRVLAQNKAEAERLTAKIKTLGFNPTVVQPGH